VDALVRFYSVQSEATPEDRALSQYLERCLARFQYQPAAVPALVPQEGTLR